MACFKPSHRALKILLIDLAAGAASVLSEKRLESDSYMMTPYVISVAPSYDNYCYYTYKWAF